MKICNESLILSSGGTEEERSPLPLVEEEEKDNLKRKEKEEEEGDNIVVGAVTCPSCAHSIQVLHQGVIHELPGLPAGVKFDPTDEEIIQHLEAKVLIDNDKKSKLHPLIDQFIPTIEGDNGICYTHPQNLPGVSKEGPIRHFFHRPSKAYTTGTRKRRKVIITTMEEENTCETRWHKTGKTRPIIFTGTNALKGYKKILVLYSIYGRQRRPEKTKWIMHQYHLGVSEDEKDGELVVSKVFYQTQQRQPPNAVTKEPYKKSTSMNAVDETHVPVTLQETEDPKYISTVDM